jgi:hypothetical protein
MAPPDGPRHGLEAAVEHRAPDAGADSFAWLVFAVLLLTGGRIARPQ